MAGGLPFLRLHSLSTYADLWRGSSLVDVYFSILEPQTKNLGFFVLWTIVCRYRKRGPGGALKTCCKRGRIPGW